MIIPIVRKRRFRRFRCLECGGRRLFRYRKTRIHNLCWYEIEAGLR